MAEKGHSENKGLGLGVIMLLIVLGVFIIWVLTGGPKKNTETRTTTEQSVWPPDDEIPSYGGIETN